MGAVARGVADTTFDGSERCPPAETARILKNTSVPLIKPPSTVWVCADVSSTTGCHGPPAPDAWSIS